MYKEDFDFAISSITWANDFIQKILTLFQELYHKVYKKEEDFEA